MLNYVCMQILLNTQYVYVCMLIGKCNWIWENHSSHIRVCSFGDLQKPQGVVYRLETFRDDKGIVVLQSLKVSHLISIILNRFFELPKLKN